MLGVFLSLGQNVVIVIVINVNVRSIKMPYIDEESRSGLDVCIDTMIDCLTNKKELNNEEFLAILGNINYVFSRVIVGTMGKTSYSKIAMVTGVLENIKQEFYRRLATPYEDKKILANGDIREYKKL